MQARSLIAFSAVLLSFWVAFPTAVASDRAGFHYFRSDGGIPQSVASLPDDLADPSQLRWRVDLASGQSTPVVCKGNLFLTVYEGGQGGLATVALDAETGVVRWRRPVQVEEIEEHHPRAGNPAPATPACDGQRLYVFFGSYGLICYDLDGRLLWEHRLGPFRDEYGAGSSPVLAGDFVILNQDHDIDSFLIAINRFTGKAIWRTARPDAVRSYSSPVPWQHDGRQELLVAGALELAGYDLATGDKLWWTHGLARIVIPMPVTDGKTIYMASWSPGGDAGSRIALGSWSDAVQRWDKDGDGELARGEIEDGNVLDRFFRMDLNQNGKLNEAEWARHAKVFQRARNGTIALAPSGGRGELSQGDQRWFYPRGAPYVATPVVEGGSLWMVKDGGIVTRLDTATGEPVFEERLPGLGSYYASPVAADGKLYFCSERGVVSIVANDKQWRLLSSRDFKERIHATPVIAGDRLYIRTSKALYAFGRKTAQ